MKTKRLDEIAEELLGSCLMLTERMTEEEQDSMTGEDWDYLNNLTLVCEGCGWWWEVCDFGQDDICLQCEEDELC